MDKTKQLHIDSQGNAVTLTQFAHEGLAELFEQHSTWVDLGNNEYQDMFLNGNYAAGKAMQIVVRTNPELIYGPIVEPSQKATRWTTIDVEHPRGIINTCFAMSIFGKAFNLANGEKSFKKMFSEPAYQTMSADLNMLVYDKVIRNSYYTSLPNFTLEGNTHLGQRRKKGVGYFDIGRHALNDLKTFIAANKIKGKYTIVIPEEVNASIRGGYLDEKLFTPAKNQDIVNKGECYNLFGFDFLVVPDLPKHVSTAGDKGTKMEFLGYDYATNILRAKSKAGTLDLVKGDSLVLDPDNKKGYFLVDRIYKGEKSQKFVTKVVEDVSIDTTGGDIKVSLVPLADTFEESTIQRGNLKSDGSVETKFKNENRILNKTLYADATKFVSDVEIGILPSHYKSFAQAEGALLTVSPHIENVARAENHNIRLDGTKMLLKSIKEGDTSKGNHIYRNTTEVGLGGFWDQFIEIPMLVS